MLNGDEMSQGAMSADQAEELYRTRPGGSVIDDGQTQGFEDDMGSQFRSMHTIDFKFYISELALKFNNNNLANTFDLTLRQVREWRRQNLLLKQAYYEKNVALKSGNSKQHKQQVCASPSSNSDLNFSVIGISPSIPDEASMSSFQEPEPSMPEKVEKITSNSNQKPRKKASYSSEYKLKAVAFAEMSTNRAAAREFNVHEKRIREWRKNKEVLLNSPKDCRRLKGAGRKPLLNEKLERSLLDWILLMAKERNLVTKNDVQRKAIELSLETGSEAKFAASSGWIDGFLKRHNLNVRIHNMPYLNSELIEVQGCAPPTMVENEAEVFDKIELDLKDEVAQEGINLEGNTSTDDSSRSIPYIRK